MSYTISVDENNDEVSNALSYAHQSMVSSEGSIAGFKSRSRLIVALTLMHIILLFTDPIIQEVI